MDDNRDFVGQSDIYQDVANETKMSEEETRFLRELSGLGGPSNPTKEWFCDVTKHKFQLE